MILTTMHVYAKMEHHQTLSGAAKRKQRKEKEAREKDILHQVPRISSFLKNFQMNNNNNNITEAHNPTVGDGEEETEPLAAVLLAMLNHRGYCWRVIWDHTERLGKHERRGEHLAYVLALHARVTGASPRKAN